MATADTELEVRDVGVGPDSATNIPADDDRGGSNLATGDEFDDLEDDLGGDDDLPAAEATDDDHTPVVDEEPAPQATVAKQPPPAEPPKADESWREAYVKAGVPLDPTADLNRVAAHTAQLMRQKQAIEQRNQQLEYLLQQQRAAQQAPAQQASAQEQPAPFKPWEIAQWDAAWEKQLDVDPEGNIVLKPGADPGLLPKYHAYQDSRRQALDKLLMSPDETIGKLIEQRLEQQFMPKVQEFYQQQLGSLQQQAVARRAQQYAERSYEQDVKWMAHCDEQGQPIRDLAGNVQYTPAGQRFMECVQALEPATQAGIYTIDQQRAMALQMAFGPQVFAEQSAAPGTPAAAAAAKPAPKAETPQERDRRLIQERNRGRAARGVSRAGRGPGRDPDTGRFEKPDLSKGLAAAFEGKSDEELFGED